MTSIKQKRKEIAMDDTNELIYKIDTDPQTEQTNMVTKGKKGWERDKLGIWDEQRHTTICKIDKKQGLLHSTGNGIQYLVMNHNEEEWTTEHFAIHQKPTFVNQPHFNKLFK